MRSGIWKAFAFAASVLVTDGLCEVRINGEPWAVIVVAKTEKRLDFKVGGDYPERVRLRVTLTDPDGHRTELPSSETEISCAGRYLGPEIPKGYEGFDVELQIFDAQTGARLAVSSAGVS